MSDPQPSPTKGKTPWLIALGGILVALRLALDAHIAGVPPDAMPHRLVVALRDLLLAVSRSCVW